MNTSNNPFTSTDKASLKGMIELSPQALEEYRCFHLKHYGKDLSGEDLETEAVEAMAFVLICAGIPVFD